MVNVVNIQNATRTEIAAPPTDGVGNPGWNFRG